MKKVLSLILCAILLALTLTGCGKTDADKYTDAKKQLASGNYTEALAGFEEINGYEDSSRFINYIKAIMLAEEGNYVSHGDVPRDSFCTLNNVPVYSDKALNLPGRKACFFY